jgi:hypothetical protein
MFLSVNVAVSKVKEQEKAPRLAAPVSLMFPASVGGDLIRGQ